MISGPFKTYLNFYITCNYSTIVDLEGDVLSQAFRSKIESNALLKEQIVLKEFHSVAKESALI